MATVKASNVRAAVWAGIGYLDTHVKGWRKKIDLKKLDLGNPECCVLGEVYGDYDDGKKELGISEEKATELGFNNESGWGMADLTAEWRAAYKAGQAKARK